MAEGTDPRDDELRFVLASLDDLEAEYAAGDLDEDDYRSLKADYTTRAARLIRADDDGPPAGTTPAVDRSWLRTAGWMALVVAVAAVAGMLIADFSGSRGTGTVTGDIRETVRQRKFEASQLLGTDPDRALEIYDEVLEDEPSDAEALAYRGWLTRLDGDPAAAQSYVEDAVRSDPSYPDARVFAAVIALDLDDVAAAAGHLDALDELDTVPVFIDQLVQAQGLRIQVVEALLLTGEPDSFAASGLDLDDVNAAAQTVLSTEPGRGIALYETVLAQEPENVDALTFLGFYEAVAALDFPADSTEGQDLMAAGYGLLTRAVEIDPQDPQALVFRAWVGYFVDEIEQSLRDLAAYDALDVERPDLDEFLLQYALREELEEAS
jgi:hypothetical protein